MSLDVVVPLRRGLDGQVRRPTAAAPATVPPHRRHALRVELGRVALVALLLAGWELADPRLVPAPSRLLGELVARTAGGTLWSSVAATLGEAVPVFVAGTAGAVVLGVLLGRAGYLADVLAPFVMTATAAPHVLAGALFALWLGTGRGSAVTTAVVLVVAVSCTAFRGAREVDKALVDHARVLGASRLDLMATVVVPGALSRIRASMPMAAGIALIGTVVGEYTAADTGVGQLISTARAHHDAAGVGAGLLVVALLGLVAARLVSLLEGALPARQPR